MNTFTDPSSTNPSEGVLSPEMEREIAATYPWMRFLAITGFIFLGLFLLGMLVAGVAAMSAEAGLILLAVAAVLLIVFFPLLYLIQSGSFFKDYIAKKNPAALVNGLKKSKAYWRFVGILMIIYLALQVISLVFVLFLGGSIMSDFM